MVMTGAKTTHLNFRRDSWRPNPYLLITPVLWVESLREGGVNKIYVRFGWIMVQREKTRTDGVNNYWLTQGSGKIGYTLRSYLSTASVRIYFN